MTTQYQFAQPQSLLEKLCQSPRRKIAPAIFAHRSTPNFHCQSFFRSEKSATPEYDARQPLVFSDGRVYEVLELHLLEARENEVLRRCCMDVIERTTSEFLPFEVWFYNSAFEDGLFESDNARGLIEYSRIWVWEFLCTKRNAVDWSRNGQPYICECR